jgi:hypothetical protein
MEEALLIVTEAQSVVGLCHKQETIACGGVDSQAFPVRCNSSPVNSSCDLKRD